MTSKVIAKKCKWLQGWVDIWNPRPLLHDDFSELDVDETFRSSESEHGEGFVPAVRKYVSEIELNFDFLFWKT